MVDCLVEGVVVAWCAGRISFDTLLSCLCDFAILGESALKVEQELPRDCQLLSSGVADWRP